MIPPGEPQGRGNTASWLRRLLRWAKSIEIQPGVDYRVRRTTGGTFLELTGTGGSGGTPVKEYKLKSHSSDVIVANAMDGTVVSTVDVNIAKPYKLRFTEIIQQTIDGQTISYDTYNTTTQVRVAHLGTTVAETQIIVPRYLVGDVIYACKPNDTDVFVTTDTTVIEAIQWLDINADGRAWARKYGTT